MAVLAAGCAGLATGEDGDSSDGAPDARTSDAAVPGAEDASEFDAESRDASARDAGAKDASGHDSGASDGDPDAGPRDANGQDAGSVDAALDAGPGDASTSDAGSPDAGLRDAGIGRDAGGPLPTNITVWIAGDSTVATGGASCPVGWGGQLAAFLDDRARVVNSARGGRSVRTWLYSVQSAMDSTGECVLDRDSNGNLILQKDWQGMLDGMRSGDFLFIQFGINDGSATCDRHVGLAAFKESYGMMAKAAKDRGTQPIFVTPVSAIACSGNVAKGTRGGYVTATQEAGREYDVPVIDLHGLSVALYSSLGFCPIPGGDVSASTSGPVGDFFCNDHTHFEKAGAVEIAQLIAQALRDRDIGLAVHLKEP
jgi:lysophospholipase L1-like esterase